MNDAALELRGLSAGYGGVAVVHELDLAVRGGEVVALLGANGAGKTTTLVTVSGLLPRLGGEVSVLGAPVRASPVRPWRLARRGVAHVPEDRSLFFDLTAGENLRLGHVRRSRTWRADLDAVLGFFPALGPLLGRRAGLLSGGEQQMLALARGLVSRPKLLMVDELSLGLAPVVVERLLASLRLVAAETGAGILLVEQHVAMALATADRAAVLSEGRVVAAGTAAELAAEPALVEASYLGPARKRR